MVANPKFNQHIQQQIDLSFQTRATPRNGVVVSYDSFTNTCTVQLSQTNSDAVGELITNVACPTTIGLQSVAPDPGRLAWVVFRGNTTESGAAITHFFNHNYKKYDYGKQNSSNSGVPRYMHRM